MTDIFPLFGPDAIAYQSIGSEWSNDGANITEQQTTIGALPNGFCGWLPRCKGKMQYVGVWSGADFCPAC